ncbi:MAG: type I methionyl aminopeptidase [Dehalococcoidia bacterium]|nr:type I methionyl aminopeptidase [Dehalococcoidia bacterium]|tara:strand:- start:985 stop:1749 length:765 start_codon:yes stop_codon:yes gene_type:complete
MLNRISGITIKSDKEINYMREAGTIIAEIMQVIELAIEPGITTAELDKISRKEIKLRNVEPAFLGLYGFPATICVSINEEIVHGIPSERKLKHGDIISVDAGVIVEGFYSDHAKTFPVGDCIEADLKLISDTSESLSLAIQSCINKNHVGDIGNTIENYVSPLGYGLVRNYTGHGIGKALHEPPQVPNFGEQNSGIKLVPGMTIAVEPMVNLGSDDTKLCDDSWTVVTSDGAKSAHFEHTILITEDLPEILTSI